MGMEYRPYYFAKEWVRAGHSVTVVAADFSHVRSTQPTCSSEEIDGIEYSWVHTPRYSGNGVRRFWNMLSFVVRLSFRSSGLARSRPDLVVASSTYPLDIFPAWLIARRSGARLVFEIHDLWPAAPIQLGGMSRLHPFILLMYVGEYFSYRLPDRIISIWTRTEPHLARRGVDTRKLHVVPNGTSCEEWRATRRAPPELERRVAEAKGAGRFTIAYAGAHGIANALHCFVEAARRLPDVQFVLVGDGPEKAVLRQLAERARLDNVLFWERVPKTEIPAILVLMDALYIGLQRQPLFEFGVSPNKLFDYMMAGKPIVHAIDTPDNIVERADCGRSARAEDAEDIARAIGELASMSPEERERLGRNGREYVETHHDFSVLANRFLEAAGALAGPPPEER